MKLDRLNRERSSIRVIVGFTLVELLVVLVILTLLAGLVGPRILDQLGGAKSKTVAVQIADLEKALDLFRLDVGRYPTTEEGLQALIKAPAGVKGWNGPYLKGDLPVDPWGNPYHYTLRDGRVEIISYGADGAPGGEGENADIRNKP
ncbi:type II secretion system major pseudopilin GspG [Tepidimonas alkaliphilus]|uniref:type II secretion system major pseudopilin GspG n=1 Tax=Tepidimonas alkaliphilus TaxID=2588942 RepID=UPI00117E6820|nr:type II secretion system major pseudopilin GspG [Tepidimonas alkaliphilus]